MTLTRRAAQANSSDLPRPNMSEWSWQWDGNCRDHAPELFFPEEERGASRRRVEQKAKSICLDCPVQPACLAHALSAGESYGIWGATTSNERAMLRSDRRHRRRDGFSTDKARSTS
jgi:WhiB family transcriptional regulator, redox-sensing transcriptional regulator